MKDIWSKIRKAADRALAAGQLLPIQTREELVWDRGIGFHVRVVSNISRKHEAVVAQRAEARLPGEKPNPFLPYEDAMFVSNLGDTHVLLLNKFNVIPHHLLIVTRAFEHQEQLLTEGDFSALGQCLAQIDGLGFYNGGEAAGASQKHKHLQIVPLPFGDSGPRLPVEPAMDRIRTRHVIAHADALPFSHAIVRLEPGIFERPGAGAVVHKHYWDMLQAVGLGAVSAGDPSRQVGPYNLLCTREWMLLVPRSREFYKTISVNALGFAGGLLVKDDLEMKMLKKDGPMTALEHTARL